MDNELRFPELSSADSEARFRRIFISHLVSEGYSEEEAFQFIFKTPPCYHGPPSSENGLDLLRTFRRQYRNQLPHSWYFEGLHQDSEAWDCPPEAPARVQTFVVLPGIFGEFIDQYLFQSILEEDESAFARRGRSALEQVQDETFSLLDLQQVPRSLAQLVKIGSLEQEGHTVCRIIVLKSEGGSLETLGSLASNVEVFRRRLEKIFAVIDEDTDIFLIGYSRGLPVTLDLVSTLHEESKAGRIPPASRAWFEKLRGVIGLGGVFYGAKLAEDVLDGEAGSTSKMVERLQLTAEALEHVPEGTSLRERGKIFSRNLATWSHMVTGISEAEKGGVSEGLKFLKTDMHKVFANERKFRLLKRKYSAPSPSGIFELVNKFILKTFKIKGTVSNYNKNIDGFKLLVKNLVEGLQSITPQARDQWWLTLELPEDLLVFSLTGTMPDSYLNDFKSPLWTFRGYHPMSSDFNAALRSNYYDVTACENTQINDSQVSHFSSRFWGQMYPAHRYKHYYLGILGTHHWGMGFPFAIEDGDKNPFPRAVLLKSISSFISSLESPVERA